MRTLTECQCSPVFSELQVSPFWQVRQCWFIFYKDVFYLQIIVLTFYHLHDAGNHRSHKLHPVTKPCPYDNHQFIMNIIVYNLEEVWKSSFFFEPMPRGLSWVERRCSFSTGCSWCASWWPWELTRSPERSGWSDWLAGWIRIFRCLSARRWRSIWCPGRRSSRWCRRLLGLRGTITIIGFRIRWYNLANKSID